MLIVLILKVVIVVLVSEFKAKQGYRFDKSFLESLPDICLDKRCGSPMEISEVLTGLKCSNPRCPTKVANRIVAIANMLGIKDIGIARANAFIDKFSVHNPLEVFGYSFDKSGTFGESVNEEQSRKIEQAFKSRNKFSVWEYVRLANLPFVQTSALQIFGDYDSLEKAYNDIENMGVQFIANKLNIEKGKSNDFDDLDGVQDVSLRALKVYNSLMEYRQDLFECLPYVEIISVNNGATKTLKVVCSDEVGNGYKTKAEFYAAMNGLYPNLHIEFLSSVTKAIDYLVWAGAEDSSARVTGKVQKVTKYNEQYELHKQQGKLKDGEHYIPIVSAKQFEDKLKEII